MATKEQNAATAKIMRQHIASCETSGLTAQQYCEDNNLSIDRFNYWKYKRKGAQAGKGFSRVKPEEVRGLATTASSRTPTVEVTLANGNRVSFFASNSLDLFKALL